MEISQELLKALYYESPDAIMIHDENGKIIEANDAAMALLEYSWQELQSKSPFDLDCPKQHDLIKKRLLKLHETGDLTFDTVLIKKRGQTIDVEVRTRLLQIDGHRLIVSIIHDITERKRTERQIEENNSIMETAEHLAGVGSWTWDQDDDTIHLSKELSRIMGLSELIVPRKDYTGLLHPDDLELVTHAMQEAFGEGKSQKIVHRILRKDNKEERTIRVFLKPVTFADGKQSFFAATQDVTEEIRIQKEIISSEARFRELFNNATDALLVTEGFDLPFVMVNEMACKMLGYNRSELLQLCPRDIHPENLMNEIKDRFQKNCAGDRQILLDGMVVGKNGLKRFVDIRSASIEIDGKRYEVGFFHDSTDRIKKEQERQLLSTAIMNVPEDVIITDSDGNIQYVNGAFEKITGYQRDEVIGLNPRVLKSGQHSESFYKTLWDIITHNGIWSGRIVNKHKNGEFITEEATITPVKDRFGDRIGFIAIKRDVTREILKERMQRQSQKLEALGRLAGGIAHDFNNILQSIVGFADLSSELLRQRDEHTDIASYNEEIVSAGHKASDLIQQILLFSRQQEQEFHPVNMRVLIKEAIKLIRGALPSNVKISFSMKSDIPTVNADPIQIHQLVMNLCTNAWQAMDRTGGTLNLNLYEHSLKESRPDWSRHLPTGKYVVLEIQDNGQGIKDTDLEKIFEPYFTTRESSGGTGLGLAVVHGIVKSHQGAIHIESALGQGTTVTVMFPASDQENESENIDSMSMSEFRGTEHLLIVENELTILNYLKILFQEYGYQVSAFSSSSKAITEFINNPTDFDIVISDLTLAEVSGFDLVQQVLDIRKNTPVIVTTGFCGVEEEEQVKQLGIDCLLYKPVSPCKMLKSVRWLIDGKTSNGSNFDGKNNISHR